MAKKPSRYVDPQAPLDSNNLPLTSYGSADLSTIPNFSKTYSETPRIADTGTASYVGDTYEHNSLDDQNVYESDLPNVEDERASNQSTIGALGDATAKFLGKTVLSTVGNLAGTVYGIGDAIANGQFSKIWDNSFMDAVDAGNKKLDDIFHVYKNSDYKDDNFLQKLFLHPTQFTDEATDTASFMAGAVLSEIATSGLGSETIVPRALKYMKYLSEGAEAAEATKALTSFGTKAITLGGDLATSIKHLAMGASYEGIVEARQATMELREKMLDDYFKEYPNEDIPQNIKDDIDDRLSKAGLFTYLSNLALVGSTNLLLFPKLFGLGHGTAKIAEGSIIKNAETGLFESATKNHFILGNIATGLTKPFEESTKFGVQGTISKTALEFWDRKNDPDSKKGVNEFLSTFAEQLAHTYTSKEGWNNIGIGMIIGALGAPGRGILAKTGDENGALSKYGYKDILDENGVKTGSEKLPSWTGGVKGSFDERAEEEKRIGKVVNDLNEHTNFFKAAKANYDALVENHSLQQDQDKALANNDIFNFQNAKDDQIHSYVSSRIKNNLYEDLMDEVDHMKKLSPDEFYTNFKGEEASDQATSREKLKFQLDTTNQFLEKAKNTRDAIKISDDVYRGDNDDLREHLVHSIAASKNLDLREKLMNQSISDLSDGLLSNTTLRATQESVSEMMDRLQQVNPTAYTLNKDKIEQLLTDSQKLREKRQDYLDIYNHLFTQEGQRQFTQAQQDIIDAKQKEVETQQKAEVDKAEEDIKKQNIKDTVAKAKDINAPITKGDIYDDKEVVGVGGGFAQLKDKEGNITGIDLKDIDRNLLQGTKEAPGDTITTPEVSNTTEDTNAPVEANIESTEEEQLTPEETAIIKVEDNNEVNTNREIIKSNYELVRTVNVETYSDTNKEIKLINLDTQRTIGNVMSYLGVDKITKGEVKKDKDGNPLAVTLRTLDIFDNDGNIEINKFVDPKLFSQNHYKPGHKVTLDVPSFSDMEERGLQDYSDQSYDKFINDINEFPIAIRNTEGKIISYIPTQTNIKNRVLEEFRDRALADNLALRKYIFNNPNRSFNTTITSKSPGYIIADLYEKQKRLFDALGDKSKLADKVKLGIVRNPIKDTISTSKDIYTDTSGNPFNTGDIVNDSKLTNGSVYSIVPSSQEGTYLVYPMKTNTIGINNARTVVEATKLFFKKEGLTDKETKSLDNIKEFNFKNFKDLTTFINRIMYNDSKPEAPDNVIFRFFNGNLYISRLEDGKCSINDIINSEEVREDLANKLANRYFSVGLQDLNSKNPYISYSLNEDGDVIEEKKHQSYQHYLNDQQAITSNIRGVHIEGNEYAFTAQPVIGISNSIQRVDPQLGDNQDIEEAQIVEPNIEETKEEEKPIEIEEPKRRLTKTRLPIDPSKIKGKPLEDINPILDNYLKDNEIYKAPKILKTLELPKVEALFKNQFLKGNKDKFYSEVIALGGGKDQTNILKNWIEANNPQTIDELKIGIAAELSYTTEINLSKKQIWDRHEDQNGWDELADTMDDEFIQQIRGRGIEEKNSDFYSNLTVPGGTNYTENEISTPQIEPSIKGHAQFSTKNGIGWFRSDDKAIQERVRIGTVYDKGFLTNEDKENLKELGYTDEEINQNLNNNIKESRLVSGEATKSRRILEVQSDLFQKGRDKEDLVINRHEAEFNSSTQEWEKDKLNLNKTKQNQFLQLLNKDNNWVNFFVKSIIQDSARKGYEEVHFPTGDTASKVEGHTTLEEHKANIQRGLDQSNTNLERLIKERDNIINNGGVDEKSIKFLKLQYPDIYKNEVEKLHNYNLEAKDKEIESEYDKVEGWKKQLDEIETEGFAKLKPIYNFYENVVQNILKKNYTIERVKDEHGNEWNKVSLDSSHKGKIYYDINPNFSVMDKLFVNLDKFSDSQQKEVVDSIIYSIEEGKKEGYSTVDDLFQYARDVFANTKDQFTDLNTDGSFDPLLEKLSDIDSNWDKFKEKTLDKLKGIGIKVAKTFDTNNIQESNQDSDTPDLDNIEEEGVPQEDFTSSEAIYQRDYTLDADQRSVKDTASAHLKLKLSLIPEVELIDGKLEPTTNFMGMNKMMDLNKVWTSLQGVLTGLETDQIYPTITELAKNNAMYSIILQNIQEDPNTAIQNEFVVAFTKDQRTPVTIKIGYADKTARRTINIFGTNRQGANDILVDSWYDKFKQSPVVIDDGTGNLVIDINKGKAANEAFTKFMSNYNPKDINLAKNLQKGLAYIGIELSLPTIDNLIKNGTRIGNTKYSGKEFLNRYISLIFKRISSGFESNKNTIGTIDEEDENSKLELNNPFISETTALTQLAKLENITNPFLYESSYVGGDGKARYSISNNTMLSKFFNKLKNEDRGIQLIQDKLATTYASTSIWGNKYLTDPTFRDNFGVHPLDSLGNNETNSPNKVFSKMNTKEKEFVRIAAFQNVGRNTSLFLAPIYSDKPTPMVIEAPKIKVTIRPDTYETTNDEAVNALYTPFISEYNRIKDVQTQQEDPTFKDKLLQEYHFGMGEKFLVYDFLNKNKELFDDKGKLKIVDPQTLERNIRPEIDKFTTELIKNQLTYWNKLGLLDKDSPFFDKSFKRKFGDFENDKHLLRSFAADYAINQFISHFNYTQLISGDPALHGKKTIDATWINYNKRLAKDIAPGLDGNFTKSTYNTIFLKDLKYTSKQFEEYQSVIKERASAYKDLNPADAQEYTTLKEHLAVMRAYGKLSPLQEAAGQRLQVGEDDPFDIDLILQPMKPVYAGTMVDKTMGIDKMYYIKTSSFPLIPSLTRGLEIDKLRIAMETAEVDRAVYESGTKLGLPINNIVDSQSEQNIVRDDLSLKPNIVTLDRDGFRIQQEVPYHSPEESHTVNEGTQGRKLILLDVDNDDTLNLFNRSMSGKEVKQLYEDLHIEKMNRAFKSLLKDIGAEDNNGIVRIKDLSKLQKILIDEATSRNYNINDVYGLQIETVNGKQRFKIPLGFNNSSNRLESIMNSLFTNRVIKSELPGFSKIQGSSAGFNKLRTIDQLNTQSKEGIIYLDPKDTELNYIRKSEDGKTLIQADILVPNWFTDNNNKLIDLTKFIKEDGTLDTDKLPVNLLTNIGIRIPTQGYNSMMSFKVKGFLPQSIGDLAIVPSEIVAQMGSDFDVDKLFMYRYHYNYDNKTNILSKIEPNIDKNTKDMSNEEIDNSIVQYFEDRYKDPELLPKILEPNGYGDLPKLVEEIKSIQGLDSDNHFFSTIKQNEFHKNNNDGIAGRGIFSLFSTFIRASQDAKLTLPEGKSINFKIGDKIFRGNSLHGKGFIEDKSPSHVVQYLQSASVDNAKEQLLGYLNINPLTMDVAGTILMAGYDENHIGYFLTQPIIREYVDLLSNSNDITNPVFKSNAQREFEAISKLQEKYKISPNDLKEEKVFSLDNMKEELKTPTDINQNYILNQFLEIKSYAKAIRQLQSAISTDTNGLGTRYVDLQVKANNIDIAKYGSTIVNADRLFENNTIAKSEEVLKKAIDLYSNILPYGTVDYTSNTNSILKEMGKADRAEINSKDLKSIYDTFKSFIYSKSELLDLDNPNIERDKLLFGSQALGNRWAAYTKTPAGKKNMLSERLLVRRGTTLNDPIRLEALNTPAANTSDTTDAMASYYRMYHKGTEEEKQLAKDIVNYFVLTGAKQGPNSISKYIPYDILEEHNFSNKLHQIDTDLRSDNFNILEGSIEQHFQHNPSKAPAFDVKSKDIHDYKRLEGFSMDSQSSYLIPDGVGHLTYPTYMSVYDKTLKNFILYKIKESTPKGSTYSRIDLLGDKNITEYNANAKDGQYSIMKANQANLAIPESINKRIEEDKTEDNNLTKLDKEVQVVDKEFLTKHFDLTNSNPETTLTKIAEGSNREYANIANDLKRILVNYPDIKLDTNLDKENVSGQYFENRVSLNLDNLESTNDPIAETSRVILHELIHAITANKIDNYDKLSPEDKKLVDRIKILFNQYKRIVDQDELSKFNSITDKLRDDTATQEEKQWYIDNKSEYYPLSNLHEFVAGISDAKFSQTLKDNNFWTKLWDIISSLLGLNKAYQNDYDALYDTTLKLGGDSAPEGLKTPLEDMSPRDAKQEFLSKYHKYDGQEISLNSFNKINESVKNNDKYSNIRLDAPFENGKRVLRVYTKLGNPLYDIIPEPKVPKSKEEKIIDKSLKRLYDIRSKFKSNPNFNKNVGLQAKVEAINEQIKQIKQENTVNIITSQAKDKLSSIESIMDRPNLMSAYDIDEVKRYLSWYANIRDYINFNEAFEEDNKNLDLIVRKALDLNEQLDKKKVETLSHYIGTEISSNIDTAGIFTSPNKDVGQMESTFESGMYSSNQKLQTIQTIIRKAELKTNDEFSKYQDEILPLFKEYQKKYRNYNNVLQLDKNGKPTGRLLNKYLDEYYTKKKYSKDDFTIKITETDKETFDNDLKTLIAELPDWNKEGTHDYAKFNQWFASHDPDQYIAKVKRGSYISKEERSKYKNYTTSTPSDKWLDPRYKALKAFGEDSTEMKVYNELDSQFRRMSKLYNNESNYIPEVSKDFTDRMLQGEFKGAFNLLKELAQNAITTKVQPKVNSNSVDINGLPNEAIPVYMMSNITNPTDKSYDLGRVLLAAKLQDFMLAHKNEVEPYLQMAKELAQKQPAYVTNTSDQTQVDEEGNPILDTSPGRAPNLTSQSNYMLESFLYDRGVEHTGASKTARIERTHLNAKGEEIKETRAITGSKIVDSISSYTRLKALGLNPVSSVGRVIWGTLSNTIYAGDRKAYGERENIKSLGYMLQASLPGTGAHSKVKALANYFDMRQQLGEIKFGKFKLPSINNPLAEATPYVLVNKTEDFIQHQTGISVLMKQKVTALDGKEYDLFDAFDSKGKWKVDQFGENPYDNDKTRLEMSSYIQSIVTAVHGDYGDITKASQKYILRNLLTMRKWLPRSIAVRFGKEYEHITLGTQKGRYLSYKMEHLAVLPLIRDMYKAFTIDSEQDNIDTRNLRMNAYELAFIPVLWGAALMLKSMVHGLYHDDNEEKAAMTFLLNSTTRVSGDLTFFFNPYSAQAVLREPIPAFKTIMDFMDVGVAVGQTLEGKGTYKTGIHKGQSKIAVKTAKAIPIINQPEKIYSALKQAIEK